MPVEQIITIAVPVLIENVPTVIKAIEQLLDEVPGITEDARIDIVEAMDEAEDKLYDAMRDKIGEDRLNAMRKAGGDDGRFPT